MASSSAPKAPKAPKAPDWEASRYLKFENERTRPARDLLARVQLESPSCIVDLGCGPANSTALLAARYPSAQLTGMDSSPNMLEKARAVLPPPQATFELGDLKTYTPPAGAPVDLFYSNAAIHWLPAAERMPAIRRLVVSHQPEGGVFALQVPDNFQEPSHSCMRETAREPGFKEIYDRLSNATDTLKERSLGIQAFPPPTELYDSLKPFCSSVDIWHTIYYHRLENHEAIVEWLRSTGLRPFLEPLDESQKKAFLTSYLEKIKKAYPVLVDGGVLLKFPRLFIVLVK